MIGQMNRGGAETLIMNLYREIDRDVIQFDFAVHTQLKGDYDDEITSLGGNIYRFPKFNGKNIFQYANAWHHFLKRDKSHKIIHGHIGSGASIYLNEAKKNNVYTIAHSHSTGTIQSIHDIIWRIFSYPTRYIADSLFACSELAGVKRFGRKFNSKNTKSYILPNGIKAEKYVFSTKVREKIREEYNLKNCLVYGHVGRFTNAKNHLFLIDLFSKLRKSNPNSKLILVGDGELRRKIEHKIGELGLINDVIITGVVDNVHEYLQAFDVFIFPSIYEGLPTTVIEAQASGLPTIISDAITKEVEITSLVKFVSLKEPICDWVDTINAANINDRGNMKKNIIAEGYEISDVAERLKNLYLEMG